MTPPEPLVRFESVTVTSGERRLLDHVDLAVADRGITAVVGPSGAGKTTLVRLINRFEVPTSGRVLVDGVDVAALDVRALRRRFGLVFQQATLIGPRVLDDLRLADVDLSEADARTLMERVGLDPGCLGWPSDTVSGGEAQRVAMARTLAAGPDVLLLDEPTSSLDGRARDELGALVRGLVDDGLAAILVSHDLDQVAALADRIAVLVEGRIVAEGGPEVLEVLR